MKNTKSIFSLIILISILGCSKYEEGPNFSIISKTKRFTGEWEGEDENYKYILNINENGTYSETRNTVNDILVVSFNGTWEFENNKEYLKTTWTIDQATVGFYYTDEYGNIVSYDTSGTLSILPQQYISSYKIYRLTQKDLWIGNKTEINVKYTSK